MIREILVPLVSGTLFGAGLTIGGMTDPARVRGFLDLFGNWDPTLAFVMGGRCWSWRWRGSCNAGWLARCSPMLSRFPIAVT
jgi:uncharacterized membrane protein YedE/YeeE